MEKNKVFHRKKVRLLCGLFLGCLVLLGVRLTVLMVAKGAYYSKKAQDLHERERPVKAARGRILDRNGEVLADNRAVCTVSVVHSQVKEEEKVIRELTQLLSLEEETVRKKVEKVSSMERIASNIDKKTGDLIRERELPGVKVDEDYKRTYLYDTLAARTLGFTGADNQGIIGLEAEYDSWLMGTNGTILSTTDAKGVDLEKHGEERIDPVDGWDLTTTLDLNIQMYAQQAAQKVLTEKEADRVSLLVMNPQNGEIYAIVNAPEFHLNDPFTLPEGTVWHSEKDKNSLLNAMWRNPCLSDTYEPGSAFKIVTASAALEADKVTLADGFYCGGYRMVEDRRIHCHKRTGHGAETFLEGIENSCNPVFMDVAARLGSAGFYNSIKQFGLLEKTGIDLPGEATTIMHAVENIGPVELATMAFGQSFQLTPVRLAATVSALINGGQMVIPHLGKILTSADKNSKKILTWGKKSRIVSEETSKTIRYALEKVVSEGGGSKAYIEGYRIGGKTATSQTLPRSAHRYIASFVGFAPADAPTVLAMCIIENPQGVYYGGTIAAPVVRDLFENILPYLGIEKMVVDTDGDKTVAK